jgi:hypothetical protein
MRIWVVEMWNPDSERWEPTVGVRLSRSAGRNEIHGWRYDNPDDKFRLVPYQSVPARTKGGASC